MSSETNDVNRGLVEGVDIASIKRYIEDHLLGYRPEVDDTEGPKFPFYSEITRLMSQKKDSNISPKDE